MKVAKARKKFPPVPKHASGIKPPGISSSFVPNHVAIVMDGNGRWAKERGLPRTAGHEAGELALLDAVYGALEIGVKYLTVYAFSTENWKRSPQEVKFLMNFNREVIHRRVEEMNQFGIKVRWSGRQARLWKSVLDELKKAERKTSKNDQLTLTMCVNYGGRAELADAMVEMAQDVKSRKLRPESITEKKIKKYLYEPTLPDVDLFLRTSGEQRTSNFLLWQSAYAEMVFMDVLWPDFDRRHLWQAIEIYAKRERRFGDAKPN
ncbi:MAG: isoprenyl transferase [Candidatus Nanopelagicales bacterium]|nr:isoprenyl transferase [Candidatus Nanopelagicales bacterium]